MVQTADPEGLSKKDKGQRGAHGSRWKGNRTGFASGLGVGWDGNRRDQVVGVLEGEDWRDDRKCRGTPSNLWVTPVQTPSDRGYGARTGSLL